MSYKTHKIALENNEKPVFCRRIGIYKSLQRMALEALRNVEGAVGKRCPRTGRGGHLHPRSAARFSQRNLEPVVPVETASSEPTVEPQLFVRKQTPKPNWSTVLAQVESDGAMLGWTQEQIKQRQDQIGFFV